ncbi:NADPH-dependent FMN reductase [Desulfofarcimen acetoxidans DSM 771]|jgi:multimeric flavodoxin WrbA|uniref:NADPH-dependent FMN reductase n=1 Tax=Desulfofarcimen acetoxidans (strain ATCC 49208 / DSM 771 / KCTC 5769 / VKM B-1644 / 5575) TaxID=485916 RepID=C8VYG4_DESAS|nr:flavodoxin family protein [Desulfofarcimen acetoxidans]ACV62845.1 NADPH-dependent FMN reductase [Desulfofarcimen acetoxidans DSM 771]
MKIIGINGSHRKGKNTAIMLHAVLDEAAALGAETELLELTDYNIKFCVSCNKCLGKPQCSITDDDNTLVGEKLLQADGIVLGSPVYWANVTALMKNFMDRTRWLHMCKNMLAGKVGAAVTIAGLRNGGQEAALRIMEHFLTVQGLYVVDSRNQSAPIMSGGVNGTLFADIKDGKTVWRRSVSEDELTMSDCRQLGRNMVNAINSLLK